MLTAALAMWGAALASGQEVKSAPRAERALPSSIAHFGVAAIEGFYVRAMDSPVDGVVNSALACAASIAMLLPAENLELLKEKVSSLAMDGRTPDIRYRASLASVVMTAPELFANDEVIQNSDEREFFASISTTLEHSLYGHQSNNE